MSAGHFSARGSFFAAGRFQVVAQAAIAFLSVLAVLQLILSGCARREEKAQSTPTSGSLAIYAALAIEPIVQQGADQFNRLYPRANVNVYPLDSRSIVDSLIYGKTDAAYFDRFLTEAESLAVVNSRKHVYRFILGSTIATWIVHPDNPIGELDSLQILKILTGAFDSWDDLGGAELKNTDNINIYLPPLGDGAWMALQDFYGSALTTVNAHYWPNDSLVIARVAEDPDGIGLVGMAVYDSRVKKVRWRHPLLADPVPANIGALQEGRYPFRIRLCYYTIADRTDLASGFLSFMASNPGQRIIADSGFLPEMVPVRIVNLSPSGDQK